VYLGSWLPAALRGASCCTLGHREGSWARGAFDTPPPEAVAFEVTYDTRRMDASDFGTDARNGPQLVELVPAGIWTTGWQPLR
jgi:hypothetical protein